MAPMAWFRAGIAYRGAIPARVSRVPMRDHRNKPVNIWNLDVMRGVDHGPLRISASALAPLGEPA